MQSRYPVGQSHTAHTVHTLHTLYTHCTLTQPHTHPPHPLPSTSHIHIDFVTITTSSSHTNPPVITISLPFGTILPIGLSTPAHHTTHSYPYPYIPSSCTASLSTTPHVTAHTPVTASPRARHLIIQYHCLTAPTLFFAPRLRNPTSPLQSSVVLGTGYYNVTVVANISHTVTSGSGSSWRTRITIQPSRISKASSARCGSPHILDQGLCQLLSCPEPTKLERDRGGERYHPNRSS